MQFKLLLFQTVVLCLTSSVYQSKNLNNMKIYSRLLTLLILFAVSISVNAQTLKTPVPSPLQKVTQGFGLSEVSLEYSRPSAKGRKVFGELVPYGKIWRTGANNATKITFGEDVSVAGQALKAGTYALYSIPGEKEWQIMFYSDLKLGGNVNAYDKANEVLSLSIQPETTGSFTETFTIGFSDLTNTSMVMYIKWENTKINLPISVSIDEKVMASIDAAMKDNRPYYQAATYYFENGKDLNKALEWINKAIEANPQAFWVLHTKAKIQKALGDMAGAVETAKASKTIAEAAGYDEYVKMNDRLIGECLEKMPKELPASKPKGK
jgi:tetratricopeptide (TPR) repeat protein